MTKMAEIRRPNRPSYPLVPPQSTVTVNAVGSMGAVALASAMSRLKMDWVETRLYLPFVLNEEIAYSMKRLCTQERDCVMLEEPQVATASLKDWIYGSSFCNTSEWTGRSEDLMEVWRAVQEQQYGGLFRWERLFVEIEPFVVRGRLRLETS
jgi:hypothetical protein